MSEVGDEPMLAKVREFVSLNREHHKDAIAIRDWLQKRKSEVVLVKLDGKTYHVTQNYSATYELPLTIREVTVIE